MRRDVLALICSVMLLIGGCGRVPETPTPEPSPSPAPSSTPEAPTLPTVIRVDRTLPDVAFVTAVAEGPDGRLWAGTFDRVGLYVSDDGGRTWQRAPDWTPAPVYDFILDEDTLLVASEHGLITTDGTRVWDTATTVYDLARYETTLYAAAPDEGLWRQRGSGWERLTVPTDTMPLSVAAEGDWLLLGTSGSGAWQSSDGGDTWTQVPRTEGDYVSVLLTVDRDVAFVRTLEALLRTTDGGTTWTNVAPRDRVFDLMYREGRVYAALRKGGVVVSDDLGETWQRLALGLLEARETLAIAPTSDDRLVAGTRDGVYRLTDGRWERHDRKLGQTRIEALARVTGTTGTPTLLAGHLNGLYRSTDGGQTWVSLDDQFGGKSVVSLAPSPWDDRVFAGTFGAGLWESRDAGRTWEWVESPGALAEQSLVGLFPDPGAPDRLFSRVAYERVYESTDAGRTWEPRWDGFGRVVEVFALAFDAQTPGRMYAGGNDGLFRSDTNGRDWRRIAPSLGGQSVLAVYPDPSVRDRVWIGTTRGLYVSDDGGTSVQPTPLHSVTVRLLDRGPSGETLIVGTQHDGLWWPSATGWEPLPDLADRQITDLVWVDETTALVATDDGLFSVRGGRGAGERRSDITDVGVSEDPSVEVWKYGREKTSTPPSVHTSTPPHLQTSTRHNLRTPVPAFHLLNPTDHLFKTAAESGAHAVVVVFPWREIEPNQNEFHWEDTDAWVRAAEYYGLRLIVRLDQPPDWAVAESDGAAPSDALNAPPADVADWADFVRRVSTRYRGRIDGYIVWNEPNLAIEWGNRPPDPAGYVELLQVAHRVIRGDEDQAGADEYAHVVAAGLAMTNQNDGKAMDERDFLRGMYEAGARGHFTALAAHPYGFGRAPDAPRTSDDRLVFARLDDLRTIVEDFADHEIPIWVTEFGWPTDDHPEGQPAVTIRQQAAYLAEGYRLLVERPWAELAAVWHLGDGVPRDDEKAGFNLLRADGRPTETLRRLQDLFSPRDLTPRPVPPVALAPDVPIHLGDSELPPPWWPLHRGVNPSTVWRGGFYLTDVPADGGTLRFELMQHNEAGTAIRVNGENVLPRPLPAEDFSASWITYQIPLTRDQLRRGYNTVTIRIGRLLPDFQQDNFVWDDVMIRNVRLEE